MRPKILRSARTAHHRYDACHNALPRTTHQKHSLTTETVGQSSHAGRASREFVQHLGINLGRGGTLCHQQLLQFRGIEQQPASIDRYGGALPEPSRN